MRVCRNSQVALVLRPQVQNKAMHDTYLRQGEMKVLEFGDDGEQQQQQQQRWAKGAKQAWQAHIQQP
jgi:hypothetical protein